MDFTRAGCKVVHLHKDEITHELTIRNLPVNPLSRRTSLCQALKHTAKLARKGSLLVADLIQGDLASEIGVCKRKAEELEQALQGELSGAAVDRLTSRCRYLICRLSRLGEESEGARELITELKSMLSTLQENNSSPSGSDDDQSSLDDHIRVVREVIYKADKTFNINSLNLKFKGDTCVRTFLLRLEELRMARNISEAQILRGFPEILEGPALSWFRTNRNNFNSYKEVVAALKDDFDIPDLDHLLLKEIRSRTQAKSETIVFFVSTVLGMFERLSREIPDAEKLDILIRNIRPEYSRDLALQDIRTISQLKSLCKRIELAQVKSKQFREPGTSGHGGHTSVVPTRSFETQNKPQTRYPGKTSTVRNFAVASVNPNTSKQSCFRCGMTNHATSFCKKSREIVCFRCGEKGVRTPECSKCNSNSKN